MERLRFQEVCNMPKEKKKEKKEGERRPYANLEFKDLVGKDVVVVLRSGVVVYGLLVEETRYHLVLANAKIIGTTHEASVVKAIINKGNISMTHTKPLALKKIETEDLETPPYPKNLERI